MSETLFISDLHLCGARPAVTELFLDFLERRAGTADALYILGDLFEYWIGDEGVDHPDHQAIIIGMAALAAGGTPLYVMHGNRDFLMGERFAAATGCTLLPDPTVVDLYGTPTLLMHGDSLCTDDQEYMLFRRMVRDPRWQQEFLARPLAERIQVAEHYREYSKMSTASKKPEIMDVNPAAVEQALREHKVLRLIHGHTHRPGEHRLRLDGHEARRIVLGDWYDHGSILRCTPETCRLERLPLPEAAAGS